MNEFSYPSHVFKSDHHFTYLDTFFFVKKEVNELKCLKLQVGN